MDDTSILLWGVLFSSIGLGYFIYGRRQKHKVAFYAGLCLMFCPWFLGDVLQLIVVSVVLMVAPRVIKL